MDVTTLIWINTLVIMAAVVVGLVVGLYEGRKIAEALARVSETASRNERLTLAVLDRLTPSPGGTA
ncbi:MAG: hypothetical protein HY694_07175 [Deltaproteobacteria bacterium]|nr:hypothetical protein [Deltaproteobacteria bacterium]